MKELIGFEIKKLLNKMLIWACFAGLGLMTVTMTANWLAPPAFSVQEDRNGQKVILEGHDAILRNQEIAAQYEAQSRAGLLLLHYCVSFLIVV